MTSSNFESAISPPHPQSSPFSISDILSKDIGQKRVPASRHAVSYAVSFSTPNGISNPPGHSMLSQGSANRVKSAGTDTPKRPRKTSGSYLRTPKISLSEAGTMVSSGGQVYAGHRDNLVVSGPQLLTPHKPASSMNTSLVSPFNTNVLLALGHRPSPSREEKEELFGENSLGMLSEVANYHSELSGAEANSSLEAPVREKFANIKLVTSTDYSDGPNDASKDRAGDASLVARCRKTSTPSILKRDKRRKRISSAPHFTSGDESSLLRHSQATVDSGFLSPHSNEKFCSSKELTFSPSIFLSRPDHTHSMTSSDRTHSSAIPIPAKMEGVTTAAAAPSRLAVRFSVSPSSESDGGHSVSSDTTDNDGGSFVTSTPIKGGKENLVRTSDSEDGWSPTVLLNKRRRHLREPNETSSGSESDAVKRPCFRAPHHHRNRKSKARTKLSPLLENACSPISRDTALHPSPLAVTVVTTPTRNVTADVSRPRHLTSVPTTTSSCSGPAVVPVSVPRPPPVPPPLGFLGSNGLLAAGVTRGVPPISGQKLLSPPAPSPMVLNRPFPAVSAFLPLGTTQFTQAHQNLLIQQNPLTRLQAPFPYNPLVPVCNSSALQGYASIIPNTAGGSYLPLVGLMAPPPNHPASYLSYSNPYISDAHIVAMNSSSSGGSSDTIGQACSQTTGSGEEGTRRDGRHMGGSVPPWFIFSNNRSEKRSRLTEAINKSLSETPSQSTKLPLEWTKYACGQTDDQKNMTEKARLFMQFRPRQLTFNEEMD